jgi:dynein heavy chain, axonemal
VSPTQPRPRPAPQALPKALGPKARREVEALLDWLVPPCLRFVRKRVKEISPTSDAALARAAMRIAGALLGAGPERPPGAADAGGGGGGGDAGLPSGPDAAEAPDQDGGGAAAPGPVALAGMDDAARARLVEAAVVFGLVWGVGGSTDGEGRQAFDAFFRCGGWPGCSAARLLPIC